MTDEDRDWERMVDRKAWDDAEWAKVRALIDISRYIRNLGEYIGGIDGYTGIQGLVENTEWFCKLYQKATKQPEGRLVDDIEPTE